MRPALKLEWASRILHAGLLRAASLLVPGRLRAEWRREWRGELWHVQQACERMSGTSWQGEREVASFCMGAFQDALCLRRSGKRGRFPFAQLHGAPSQCILILGTILAVSFTIAQLLPGVRAERSLSPGAVRPGLVTIEEIGENNDTMPKIPQSQYRSWADHKQKFFDGFAFYRVTTEVVERNASTRGNSVWSVGRAGANLFTLLGLPIRFRDPDGLGGSMPEVILSEKTWKRDFGSDPHVAGVVVQLGEQAARIAGVAPDSSLELPRRVDAWMLGPDSAMPGGGTGYVLAHLTPAGEAEMWAHVVRITAYGPDASQNDLLGFSLSARATGPWILYLFAVFLALVSLPAITSVSLGEYSQDPQGTSWSRKFTRWSFLSAKIALLLAIVYFASLDLAYGQTTLDANRSAYIQLMFSFLACLFGMRWVLGDQRHRCPVCLRRVSNPAQVGQASQTFLAWNGTEMMCMGGHTLLHVPSLPTSWFGTQRWMYLDTSWGFLFAGSTRPIP